MTTQFEMSLARGRAIEDWAIGQLLRDRWSVIRLADQPVSAGHGPRLDGGNNPTLPDLQIMKHGQTLAVEVKGKTSATDGRLSGEPEHGVDQACWDSCVEYDRLMPTFLLIVEAGRAWTARDAYIARVNTLGPRFSRDGRSPMVYFPRSQMRQPWLDVLNGHVARKLQRPARHRRDGAAL